MQEFFQVFIFGFLVGLGAAAFPGPINLEVVRRAISRGAIYGMAFGLGAVSADAVYVTATSLGAVAFFRALPTWGRACMMLVGAALLVYIGNKAFRAKPTEYGDDSPHFVEPETSVKAYRLARSYVLGLSLTLSSPTTIFYWVVISLKAAQFAPENAERVTIPLLTGVVSACSLWVIIASTIAGRFHRKIGPRAYLFVERIAGVALLVFASISIYEAIRLLVRG